MKKWFAYAGIAASVILVAFGIGAIVIGGWCKSVRADRRRVNPDDRGRRIDEDGSGTSSQLRCLGPKGDVPEVKPRTILGHEAVGRSPRSAQQ